MSSKAKSGMSAVRQFFERVFSPPNTFTPGATSFTGPIRDGQGQAEYHAAVVNDNPFTLTILHSWLSGGLFTQDKTLVAVLDPATGKFVADLIAPVTKRYIQLTISAPGPGLGAAFEAGLYFNPRASFASISATISVSPLVTATITGVTQSQNIETIVALAAATTFNGAARACATNESFGVSAFVQAGVGALDVTVLVENSSDGGVTWREVDTIKLVGGVGESRTLNRTYSTTRNHYRASITNNDAVNALAATELVTMQKPI